MRTSRNALLALATAAALTLAPASALAESNVTSFNAGVTTGGDSTGIYGVLTIPGLSVSFSSSGLGGLGGVADASDGTSANASGSGDVSMPTSAPTFGDDGTPAEADPAGSTDAPDAGLPAIDVDVTRGSDLSRSRDTNINVSVDLDGVTVDGDLSDVLSPVSEAISARQAARLARLEALRDSLHISTSRTRDNDVSVTVNTDHTSTTVEHASEGSVSYDSDTGLNVTHDTSSSVAVTANLGGSGSSDDAGGSSTSQDDEATGSVSVEYVADDGTVLKARSYVRENARVGRSYYTSQLSFEGYTFVGLASGSAPASGTVVEGEQHVVYVYTKATGAAAASSSFDGAVDTVAQAVAGTPSASTVTTTTTTTSEGMPVTGDGSIPVGVIAAMCGAGVAIVVGAIVLRRRSR